MGRQLLKNLKYCFLLVLLLHVLFFLGFTLEFYFQEAPDMDRETQAQHVLPAYVADQEPSPPQQQQTAPQPSLADKAEAKTPVSDNGILKPTKQPEKTIATAQPTESSRPKPKTKSGAPDPAPANLVADKETDKPLIKLLSRATGAKLRYPKTAQDFHITGMVRISFYITPEGIVSQVVMLKSSGHKMLDDAAMSAITQISPVDGVNKFLHSPRTLTVGIIFEG
jgi:protein TonB